MAVVEEAEMVVKWTPLTAFDRDTCPKQCLQMIFWIKKGEKEASLSFFGVYSIILQRFEYHRFLNLSPHPIFFFVEF
jgi:hypothetical protein